MPYTSDWFESLAKANFETYVKPFGENRVVNYLEVGTYEGASLSYMFNNVLTTPGCTATVIDPFNSYDGILDVFNGNLADHLSNITLMKGLSADQLPNLQADTFDIIYIDADKQSAGVLADAKLAFPLLKSGGMMIFDDYLWIAETSWSVDNINNPRINEPYNPYNGINQFVQENSSGLETVVSNWQLIVKKY